MLLLRVVEHLDVIEHLSPSFFAGLVGPAPDPFALEQIEKALGNGVVVTVPAPAHRMLQVVAPQKRGPVHAGELAALVRVDQHIGLRLATPDGHPNALLNLRSGQPWIHEKFNQILDTSSAKARAIISTRRAQVLELWEVFLAER